MAPKAKAGRKPYRPSDDQRTMVRLLKATGMPHLSIAHVIGVASNTLEKHFRHELDFGRAEIVAEITKARYDAAMKGNAGAQNKLLEQAGALPMPETQTKAAAPAKPAEPKEAKPPKLGKKQQQRVDAETAVADTDWSKLLQ